jgi:hypothetical protein
MPEIFPKKNEIRLGFDPAHRFCYDWPNSSFPRETFSLALKSRPPVLEVE